MGRVGWSDRANADLERFCPVTVRGQLRRCAEEVLHLISPHADREEEGIDGEIMWHRGDGHGRFMTRRGPGPQDYFLLYRRCHLAPGSKDPEFEVLAVRSIHQVAAMWLAQTSDPGDAADAQSL